MALFDETFSPCVPFGSRNLSTGNVGTDVAVLQAVYNLMVQTISRTIGSPVPVDGRFGAGTRDAVVNIQSYFGLPADGVVGPHTFFVYGQGVGPDTTYGGPVYGSRRLQPGSGGGDVTILQNRLNCFRYARISGHPATGSFDPSTSAAVMAFKRDAESHGDTGFPPGAIAGYGTYNASWIYTLAGGRDLASGRNGFDVAFLQTVLKGLGFLEGDVTGYFDAATQGAVRAFQVAQGIAADGVAGPQTFYRIGLENDVPAPAPLAVAWPATTTAVSVCSVPLFPAVQPHSYGVASLVINDQEGFQSLDVTGNVLADPASFGGHLGQYAFTLTDPSTGAVVSRLMEKVTMSGGEDDWAGTYSVGVATIPKGPVAVYPTPARSATGPYGPKVLCGDLRQCK